MECQLCNEQRELQIYYRLCWEQLDFDENGNPGKRNSGLFEVIRHITDEAMRLAKAHPSTACTQQTPPLSDPPYRSASCQ